MKTAIHPTYYPNAKILCACGFEQKVGSTVEEIHVELCSHCHPFYTGKQKLVDTSRRVEKFENKVKAKTERGSVVGGKKVKNQKRAVKKAIKKQSKPKLELTA